jgi:hypothetical protein
MLLLSVSFASHKKKTKVGNRIRDIKCYTLRLVSKISPSLFLPTGTIKFLSVEHTMASTRPTVHARLISLHI